MWLKCECGRYLTPQLSDLNIPAPDFRIFRVQRFSRHGPSWGLNRIYLILLEPKNQLEAYFSGYLSESQHDDRVHMSLHLLIYRRR